MGISGKEEEIKNKVADLKSFFDSTRMTPFKKRVELLKMLRNGLQRREEELYDALRADLHKPPFEAYTAELGLLEKEITHALKNLRRWLKPEKKRASWLHLWTTGTIYRQPHGVVLIMAPWNYPLQLSMIPLVNALAAGNSVLLKPSEYASRTSEVIAALIREELPPTAVTVVRGEKETGQLLLEQDFDFVFFTGSTRVGSQVMKKAAEKLIPVCLELGGKSPCLVDGTVKAGISASRIIWGKFINAGQTCVAPDYILLVGLKEKDRQQFMFQLKKTISDFYGNDIGNSKDYGRIINEKHWLRLTEMLSRTDGKIVCGGETDKEDLYIAPTIVEKIQPDDSLMKEEIFGPLLPVMEVADWEQAQKIIEQYSTPLSLYLFSGNRRVQKKVIDEFSFGGGCINDTVIQVSSPRFPFGGQGASGLGRYHGQAGFNLFTRQKTVMNKTGLFDIPLRYPPYKQKLKWIKRLFRWF